MREITSLIKSKFGVYGVNAAKRQLKFTTADERNLAHKILKTAKYLYTSGIKDKMDGMNIYQENEFYIQALKDFWGDSYKYVPITDEMQNAKIGPIYRYFKIKPGESMLYFLQIDKKDDIFTIICIRDDDVVKTTGNFKGGSAHFRILPNITDGPIAKYAKEPSSELLCINGGLFAGIAALYNNVKKEIKNYHYIGLEKYVNEVLEDYTNLVLFPSNTKKIEHNLDFVRSAHSYAKEALKRAIANSTDPNSGSIKYFKKQMRLALRLYRDYYVLNNYLNSLSNGIAQERYERSNEKRLKAAFYQTKKHISNKYQAEMDSLSTEWKDYVSYVEIDSQSFKADINQYDQVDLTKLEELRPEFTATFKALPKSNNGQKPILRFRRLQNHRALGMFAPVNNTIALDYRDFGNNNVGLRSFIHEYGHFLDYNTLPNNELLSLQVDFQPIIDQVVNYLNKNKDKIDGTKKFAYLSSSTEIFARSFEYYVKICGLSNNLIKSDDVYDEKDSLRFAPIVMQKEAIMRYFQKVFPALTQNIKFYNANGQVKKKSNDEKTKKRNIPKKEHKSLELSSENKVVQISLF